MSNTLEMVHRSKILQALLIRKRNYVTHGGWDTLGLKRYTGIDDAAFGKVLSKMKVEGLVAYAHVDGLAQCDRAQGVGHITENYQQDQNPNNYRWYITNEGLRRMSNKQPRDMA